MLPIYDKFYNPDALPPARMVPPSEHPSVLCLPRLRPLALLGNAQYLEVIDGFQMPVQFWPLYDINRNGGGWLIQEIEIDPFLRLLAKIGHSAAVAALGFDGFKHQLLPIIAGDMSRAMEMVGDMPANASNVLPIGYPRGLHEIGVGIHTGSGVPT
jgi:hypothetical protein